MELELKIPDVLPYKSSDLCIVLGNLLDNAMEATEKLENEKDIFVSLLYQKEKCLLRFKIHTQVISKKIAQGITYQKRRIVRITGSG